MGPPSSKPHNVPAADLDDDGRALTHVRRELDAKLLVERDGALQLFNEEHDHGEPRRHHVAIFPPGRHRQASDVAVQRRFRVHVRNAAPERVNVTNDRSW
jgi:hypothetical protein